MVMAHLCVEPIPQGVFAAQYHRRQRCLCDRSDPVLRAERQSISLLRLLPRPLAPLARLAADHLFAHLFTRPRARRGTPTRQGLFDKKTCAECVIWARCPRRNTGSRELTLPPQTQQLALQAARARPHPETCEEMYKHRADIADTLSQAVFAFGRRPTRYRGCMKPHLQHIATAASITLHR